MNQKNEDKVDIINYLDRHVEIKNRKVTKVNIKDLRIVFPNFNEIFLCSCEKEWRNARQCMLDIKF